MAANGILIIAFIIGSVVLSAGALIGLFFAIRYFIRYNAEQNKRIDQQQEEIDRMKIGDL